MSKAPSEVLSPLQVSDLGWGKREKGQTLEKLDIQYFLRGED